MHSFLIQGASALHTGEALGSSGAAFGAAVRSVAHRVSVSGRRLVRNSPAHGARDMNARRERSPVSVDAFFRLSA